MEEEVNGEVDLGPPLDSSTIHWRPPEDGIVLLELFGGIGSGLVAVLQARLKVKRYIYVDGDEAARQVAKPRRLRTQFPGLLAISAIKTSFSTLVGDIALLSVEDIHCCGHVDLVIAGWPCQGMSMAGK
jgi:site-specific DNA-cytosine methylase